MMIPTSLEQLNRILSRKEDCNLEFKEASVQFDGRHDLPDYCAALANERGGKLILGVNQKGEIVGSKAFLGTHNTLSNELLNKLGIRVDVEEVLHPSGRVLIFHVPSRPVGSVIRSPGRYKIPMRAGESLREMDDLTLKSIMNENAPDFSAQLVETMTENDLDPSALQTLRRLCAKKAQNQNYLTCSQSQLLLDLGLQDPNGYTNACLILLGKIETLNRLLPQAEIIFEWRQIPGKIQHDFRKNWRTAFLNCIDEIWIELNRRNLRTPFQEGFFQREIFAFDEASIREAVLNAVTHRDYSIRGRVIFITASPDGFLIESPGGFLPGITPDNAVFSRAWRNQRIAEIFEKTGLVERSGQGLDMIYTASIRAGKGLPDLSKSDLFTVRLQIPAQVKDINFIRFLEKIINERQINLSFEEIFEIEKVRTNGVISNPGLIKKFLALGIIEKQGKTRDARYLLSHRYYSQIKKSGVHTRIVGLKREKHKQLIVEHLQRNQKGYAYEFKEALQELSATTIRNILYDLKKQRVIEFIGPKKTGYWRLIKH